MKKFKKKFNKTISSLSFNVPTDWHLKFKITAAAYGMTMRELLFASFEAWLREQKQH